MSATIDEYKKAISKLKKEAMKDGKEKLVIKAGDLHKKVNKGSSPSYMACCSAMKSQILEGDEILNAAHNKTGASSAFTVQYDLSDMENRACMDISDHGDKGMKAKGVTLRKINKTDMTAAIESWLNGSELSYTFHDGFYLVNGENGLWKIYPGFDRRGKHQTFYDKIFHILKDMDDDTEKYSLVVEDSVTVRNQWNRISDTLKHKVNLTIFFVSAKRFKEVF